MLTGPPPKFHGTRDILRETRGSVWACLAGTGLAVIGPIVHVASTRHVQKAQICL